jgi:hypothetical protein
VSVQRVTPLRLTPGGAATRYLCAVRRIVVAIALLTGCSRAFGLVEVDRCRGGADEDGDGVSNDCDNCPPFVNPTQEDTDGDSVGDACDPSNDLTAPHHIAVFETFDSDLGDLQPLIGDFTVGASAAVAGIDKTGMLAEIMLGDVWVYTAGTITMVPDTQGTCGVGIWVRSGPIPTGGNDFTGYMCNMADVSALATAMPNIAVTREPGFDPPDAVVAQAQVSTTKLFSGERFEMRASAIGAKGPMLTCSVSLDSAPFVDANGTDLGIDKFPEGWVGVRTNRSQGSFDYVLVVAR